MDAADPALTWAVARGQLVHGVRSALGLCAAVVLLLAMTEGVIGLADLGLGLYGALGAGAVPFLFLAGCGATLRAAERRRRRATIVGGSVVGGGAAILGAILLAPVLVLPVLAIVIDSGSSARAMLLLLAAAGALTGGLALALATQTLKAIVLIDEGIASAPRRV